MRLEDYILPDANDPDGMPDDLIFEVATKFHEDGSLVETFGYAVMRLSERASKLGLDDDYKSVIAVSPSN